MIPGAKLSLGDLTLVGDVMDSLVGQTLGKYQLIERIGVGGMASVFKAYQPGLERYVALKVLPPFYAQQPGFQERFIREAKAIAKLNHPNILPVYDYGQSGDYSYLVMRYVEAGSLQHILGQPVAIAVVVKIVSQIGMALDAAHRMGIIHRDVKPANVLLDKDNWALLTDFGLARILEESIHLTGTGVGIGTPAYMSPEQGQGGAVDHRTDIYSLGVVLFQMLTGDIPYKGDTPLSIVLKRMTEPLPVPRSLNPDIAEAVEAVVLKSLAKEPADRFQSVAEMVEKLNDAANVENVAPSVAGGVSLASRPEESEETVGSHHLPLGVISRERDASSRAVPDSPAQSVKVGSDGTIIAPAPGTSDSSPVHGKRAGCPMWIVGSIALLGIALLLASVVLALKTLPGVIQSMQTRQVAGAEPVATTIALPPIMPPPDGGQAFAPPVMPVPEGGQAFVPPSAGDVAPVWGAGTRVQRADLPPGLGAVSGVVWGRAGETLPGVNLEFLDRRGEKALRAVVAGPDGGYDAVLPVGRYLLAFRDHMDRRNFVPQFYDNQNYIRALDAADVIEVTEGEELQGVDLHLEHGFAVSGRLVGPKGEPVGDKGGSLASRDAGVVLIGPLGFTTAPDGRFRVVVPPGQYVLTFEAPLVHKELFAPQPVRVTGNVDLGDIVYERKLLPDD